MRGKAALGPVGSTAHSVENSIQTGVLRPLPADSKEFIVSTVRRIAVSMMTVLAVFLATPADAQNLDAGKTPAQIFADTCSACHRRAQELRRASTGFLRSHYTTGQAEAASMASYLAGLPADPRANQKRQPGAGPTPPETVPSRRQEQSKEQTKEQAKSPQTPADSSKGRRPARAEAKGPAAAAPPAEIEPPEPAVEAAPPSPPAPPLEAFDE